MAQDGRLELAELGRWLQAQLVLQQTPELPVDLERFGLPPVAVEGQHELAAQTLSQGMLAHEPP